MHTYTYIHMLFKGKVPDDCHCPRTGTFTLAEVSKRNSYVGTRL